MTIKGWALGLEGQAMHSVVLTINGRRQKLPRELRPDVKDHLRPALEAEEWCGFKKTFYLPPGRYKLILEGYCDESSEGIPLWGKTIWVHSFSSSWQKIKRAWKKTLATSSPEEILNILRRTSLMAEDKRNKKGSQKTDFPGVNVVGFFGHDFGLAQAARSSVACLKAAEVPNQRVVAPMAVNSTGSQPEEEANCREGFQYPINLLHVNAPELTYVQRHLPEFCLPEYYNIGFWYWELPEITGAFRSELKKLDELWVASSFNFKAFHAVSPVPVHQFPPCLPPRPWAEEEIPGLTLPNNRFLVLFIYDCNSYMERKNPEACLEACLKARESCPNIHLVLKTHSVREDSPEWQRLMEKVKDCPEITVISRHVPRAQLVWLQKRCDVFLSLHRAEGFGLNLAECMALGKPVVATNYSGNTDFMTDENSCLVDYDVIPVPAGGFYGEYGGTWADPKVDHAVEHLVSLAKDPAKARRIGQLAKEQITEYCCPIRIGKLMRERLEMICENRTARGFE